MSKNQKAILEEASAAVANRRAILADARSLYVKGRNSDAIRALIRYAENVQENDEQFLQLRKETAELAAWCQKILRQEAERRPPDPTEAQRPNEEFIGLPAFWSRVREHGQLLSELKELVDSLSHRVIQLEKNVTKLAVQPAKKAP